MHSRCNLACTYCYLYTGPDDTWRDRPSRVARPTVRRTAERIAEHVTVHGLRAVRIDLHGGEPLLGGAEPLLELAAHLRAQLPAGCEASLGVQTNGTLLTPALLDALADAGFHIGLSLDGAGAELNARRVDHAGRPSWPAVRRAVELLTTRRPEAFAGILTTVDVRADPVAVYRSLRDLHPPTLDFLLPHANWSAPPQAPPGAPPRPHGRWLCRVFDQWWHEREPAPPVGLFTEVIGLLLGRPSSSEAVGLSPVAALVVDTDGAIEQVDSLRSAYQGAASTGLDVFHHSFDEALRHPGVLARQSGLAGLAAACRSCALVEVCGGGNYAHRYRDRESGFVNPSVYCPDLELVIRHVADRLAAVLPPTPADSARS
ncbi:FxsB family cyclophane-forming radical SAM/SPASM peptide maturase [Streptomyces sp. NPDC059740]|uniref:FxsB family cyclophane-forming radical SAM/SPASM peptide maturase n=1 Tax=Streptomyces sp. NPDC059740 TaxID=3346926 RepID=UPI0036491CAC